MRKTTVHILSITTSVLLTMAGASFTVISCTKTTAPGTEASPEGAITFSGVDTKAAVEDASEISEFSVWGYYTPEDASSAVFNKVKVTKEDNQWEYDGLRFWQSGKQYNFYALYPAVETLTTGGVAEDITCDASGALSITGFDSTKGHDLMTASCTGMLGSDPQPVAFTFSHMLSKVSIIGKVQGGSATVTSAMLTDLIVVGNYNKSWSNSNTSNTSVSNDSDTELSALGANVFGKDMLLVPQSTNAVKFSIEYNTDTETGKTETFSLSFSEIPNWEPGKSYRYTFTIIGDYIVFDDPTVRGWNDAVGGNVVIDVTQP